MKLFKRKKKRGWIRKSLNIIGLTVLFFLSIPQSFDLPVEGMKINDFNHESYWYYPWGKSGTHKGVDIFAKTGTKVNASVRGFTFATGSGGMSGKFVIVLGPKLRFHYFAHLNSIKTTIGSWNNIGDQIGTVGATGNAKGKPAHLHYSIVSWVPHFWRIDFDPQGWKKMFFLNPIDYIMDSYDK